MSEYSEAIFTDKATKRVALLLYISDQLRCYAEELEVPDDVLPAFADMLDELADELQSANDQDSGTAQPMRAAIR